MDYTLSLNKDARVPVPRSKTSLVYLASLQKKKSTDIFQPSGRKTIVTYQLKEDILGQEIVPA